jgi:hypothetical protein
MLCEIQILVLLSCSNVTKFVPVPRYLWDFFSDLKLGMENFVINHLKHSMSPGLTLKRTQHFK